MQLDPEALAAQAAQVTQLDATRVATGFSWPEIPRWHDGAFWFSDMYNHKVLRLDADGTQTTVLDLTDRQGLGSAPGAGVGNEKEVVPGGMGWLPDGRLILNSMHERLVLVWDGSELQVHADLREHATSSVNDMVVDADGRAYITQLGYDIFAGETPVEAALLVVEPDGRVHVEEGAGLLAGGNGITVSADGRTVVVAEVDETRITAFDRAADGSLSGRRVFATLHWLPDGICLDDEGGVWAGMPGSGYVGRFVEGGEMTEAVVIPMDQEAMGTAVVLGGDDRSTLYVCCGMETFDWAKSRDEGKGSIWTAKTSRSGGTNRP